MTNTMTGSWSSFNFTLSDDAQKVFKEALKGFAGVDYTPLAVATQVVAGTNYCFLCKGVLVTPGAQQTAVKLYVYAPLPGQGSAHISQITNISPAP
ncbi:MAG TPA: hypothetical protein VNA24_05805 [Hyalangium sp.]|jgi:hypothetical protein|nr:hypothetical protein [Hyalangium sp.]